MNPSFPTDSIAISIIPLVWLRQVVTRLLNVIGQWLLYYLTTNQGEASGIFYPLPIDILMERSYFTALPNNCQ